MGSLPCCAGGKYCRPASGDRRAGPEAIPPGRADRRRAGDRRGVGRDGRDGCGDVAAAGGPITTIATAAPNGRAVPTANVPVGSVEQVAAKVVPSVVKLETKMGRASEEAPGIVLSEDG